jgi:hypothetical protein
MLGQLQMVAGPRLNLHLGGDLIPGELLKISRRSRV